MMGDAAGLSLPSAAPAPAATAAPGAPAVRAAATGTAQDASATPTADADLLFDLLLGGQPEAAMAPLAEALPGATRAASGEPREDAPAADPLLTVLAQMPQLPQAAPTPVAATPSLAVAPADTGMAAAAAAATRPFPALSPMPPSEPLTAAPDAAAPTAMPALSPSATAPANAAPDTGRAMAPAAQFASLLQGLGPQPTTTLEVPLPGVAASATEPAGAPLEASTPAPPAPFGAVQALAGAQRVTVPVAALAAPVLSQPADPGKGYDDGFSSHVAWLAGQRIGQAEIRVAPEHLGAIDIRLQLDGNNVRAEFHSSQPEVRQALEASLPRLREMLGQHGLQLAHAGVGQGQGGQRQSGDGQPQPGHGNGLTLPDDAGSPLPPDFRRARGLLDVYA